MSLEDTHNDVAPESVAREREDETNPFTLYLKPLASRTRKRQARELASLRAFLLDQGHAIGNISNEPIGWSRMQATFVKEYVEYLRNEHYQPSTIDKQLDTIKIYARLAMNAGYLPQQEYEQIHRIQAPPATAGEPRRGEKRSQYLDLSDEQVQQLLKQPDTREGRRDKLLLALLLYCGFWPREIAALDRHSIALKEGTITFYDYHAEEQQTLRLDSVTLDAASKYLQDSSPYEALFVGNHKDSTHTLRLSDRAINARVRTLGKKMLGVDLLAPQDCHAYWEKSLRSRKQQAQPTLFDLLIVDEAHRSVTTRPPRRKQRPDIFNRRAFEESMQQDGEAESMLARFVNESRLLLPWSIEFINEHDPLREQFVQYIQQKLQEYGLQGSESFYEKTLEYLASWMSKEMRKYRDSRS